MRTFSTGLMIALAVAASGCGAPPPPAAKWEIFETYPGARLLCTQRVYGAPPEGMHFTWWAYVTADSPDKVTAFYESRHRALRAHDVQWFTLRGPGREGLSVHAAADGGYPTCDQKPAFHEKTVIIVSSGVPSDQPTPRAGPSLRFGTSTRGCSDAYVVTENADGTEVLAVLLARDHVPLSTKPRTFQIEDRPEGLNVAVFVYAERPTATTHCSDVVLSRPPQRTRWTASRGRVTASISEAAPKPGHCYKIDVRLDDVVFAADDHEVTLPHFEFKGVGVGHLPPMNPCP